MLRALHACWNFAVVGLKRTYFGVFLYCDNGTGFILGTAFVTVVLHGCLFIYSFFCTSVGLTVDSIFSLPNPSTSLYYGAVFIKPRIITMNAYLYIPSFPHQ